jgi:hypothetical protein
MMFQTNPKYPWRNLYIFPILFLAFIVLGSMCPNKAPVISSLTATPSALDWGGTSSIVVVASDEEGDVLTYSWTCSGGEFTTPAAGTTTVTWQAPDESGSFTITVSVSDEENTTTQSTTITVTAHPDFNVSPTSLNFGKTTTSLNLNISNTGTGELTWTVTESAAWLSVSPASGSTTTETDAVAVTVNRTGLNPGTYTTTITITSNENPMSGAVLARSYNATINVQMEVPDPPELSVSKTIFNFGQTTTSLTFNITNTGEGTLTWTISDDAAWLSTNMTSGSTTTETDQITANVNRTGLAEGHYDGLITIASNGGTEMIDVDLDVPALPLYDFFDDFSAGLGNWTFGYCNYSITTGGELELVSTSSSYQAYTTSFTFSPYLDIPWTYTADMTIVSSSSSETDNGISVYTNDTGTFALERMWLSVRKNSTSRNWIWLWWIPSLASQWLPWDSDCYGTSSYVYTNNQKNTLEMSVDSNENFTLKANNHTLSSANNAVNEMESMAGINITLLIRYVRLRGGAGTTTRWDNIIFNSETTNLLKVQETGLPAPPSDEYVDGLLERIQQGEDVTLKSVLIRTLEKK